MRDIQQIEQEIAELQQKYGDDPGYYYDQDQASDFGMLAGFRAGLKMIQEGKTSEEITAYAQRDQHDYVSHGDDLEDAWQSGYSCALFWVGEQFDWDDDGVPIFRPGNIFNEPVGS